MFWLILLLIGLVIGIRGATVVLRDHHKETSVRMFMIAGWWISGVSAFITFTCMGNGGTDYSSALKFRAAAQAYVSKIDTVLSVSGVEVHIDNIGVKGDPGRRKIDYVEMAMDHVSVYNMHISKCQHQINSTTQWWFGKRLYMSGKIRDLKPIVLK